MSDDTPKTAAVDERLEQARERSSVLQRQADQLLVASIDLRKTSQSLLAQLHAALRRRPGE